MFSSPPSSFAKIISAAIILIMFAIHPVYGKTVHVSTVQELMWTINLNKKGDLTVILNEGVYTITKRITIYGNNVTYKGSTKDTSSVVIKGNGVKGFTANIFSIAGNDVEIANLKIGEVKSHAVQIHGEKGIRNVALRNVHFYDTGQQMVKGSYSKKTPDNFITGGLIEDCIFEFTKGKAYQFYTGGIDVHHGVNWNVRNNLFKNIQNPGGKLTEGAIHFWNHSKNIVVTGNKIINCDRGIIFGLDQSPLKSGLIFMNSIHVVRDTGIYLCNASDVDVLNNTVYVDSNYPNAIEYRFKGTQNVLIANNLVNKSIRSRHGGKADVVNNVTSARDHWFVDTNKGDLRLNDKIEFIHGKGVSIKGIANYNIGESFNLSKTNIGSDQDKLQAISK